MRHKITLCASAKVWRIARQGYTDPTTFTAAAAMLRSPLVALCVALLGAGLALPAAAQWKWRDKGGHMQYSDLPPPAGTAEADILLRPNSQMRRAALVEPAASAASAAPKLVDPELEARRRKAEQETASTKKAEDEKQAAARAENCTRAKGYQRTLDDGMVVQRTNDKGEREFLDDKARAEETRRTREIISSDCK